MSWLLSVRDKFQAAHYLREYKGKCERVHGHTFQVEVKIEVRELDPTGWCDLEMINGALDGARFEGTTSGGPFAGRRYQPLRVEAEHVPAPSSR